MFRRAALLFLAGTLGLLLYRAARPRPTSAAALLPQVTATPAAIDESAATAQIYVNPGAPGASDANVGSSSRPLATIARAAALAMRNKQSGVGTRVLIQPGTYRESITLANGGGAAPIVFQSAAGGPVVVSGSDVWTNWQASPDGITYTAPWPYQWGLAPYPNGWQGNVVLMPIVRRREMIFVNGQALRQVLTSADLDFGTFLVQEDAGTVSIRPNRGVSIASAPVEVATRPVILSISNQQNVVLRGITFQHGNTALPDGAVQISSSTNVLIDQCNFANNNWIGLETAQNTNLTIRASTGNSNGGEGFDGYEIVNLYLDHTETSRNNWRGAAGGLTGWAPAGAKFTGTHAGLFLNHKASSNLARGLWLDYNNTSITIDGADIENNQNDGVFLEANQGPVLIESSWFLNNSAAGLAGANTTDVTLKSSLVCGNAATQVLITGDYTRSVTDWSTNATSSISAERWSLQQNSIATAPAVPLLVQAPNWQPFLSTYEGDGNTWRSARVSAFGVGTSRLSLKGWQRLVSSDRSSTARSYEPRHGETMEPCVAPVNRAQ